MFLSSLKHVHVILVVKDLNLSNYIKRNIQPPFLIFNNTSLLINKENIEPNNCYENLFTIYESIEENNREDNELFDDLIDITKKNSYSFRRAKIRYQMV